MRHQKNKRSLNQQRANSAKLYQNLAQALISHEAITTTQTKAKFLKSYLEPLITKAKANDLTCRRILLKFLNNEKAVNKLMTEIAPKVKTVNGGCLRLTKLYHRSGDGALLAKIEFIL